MTFLRCAAMPSLGHLVEHGLDVGADFFIERFVKAHRLRRWPMERRWCHLLATCPIPSLLFIGNEAPVEDAGAVSTWVTWL
jgi:hypothetical protein